MSILQNLASVPTWHHRCPDDESFKTSCKSGADSGHQNVSKSTTSFLCESLNRLGNGLLRGGRAEGEDTKKKLQERRQVLYHRMYNATCYEEWRTCATALDELEGNNEWKDAPESEDYDFRFVQARLKEMDDARISCDPAQMLHLIRTTLSRDLGSMSNPDLFKHSHVGTKDLVERYINSTVQTLESLLNVTDRRKCDASESRYMMEQLLLARQAFGRSALMLSGGATFGMNHIGVVKALYEERILPRIINGASAGSIICAVLCIHTDDELPDVLEGFAHGDLTAFGPPDGPESVLVQTARFLKKGSFLDSSHLIKLMQGLLGDMTFQEAYYRTRRILNICVSSAGVYEQPRLLNYITSPNVLIWSAVAASCSVPILFTPSPIYAKDTKTGAHIPWNNSFYLDGSVDNDIPTVRLAEMFNVNHFIVSQVNPHIVPFLAKEEEFVGSLPGQAKPVVSRAEDSIFQTVLALAKDEALFRLNVLSNFGVFPGMLSKAILLLSQKYSGDINIFPRLEFANYARMIQNPTPEFMLAASLCGERATWPKMSRIRNSVAIELALDRAVQDMRARATLSDSPSDLRISDPTTRGRKANRSRRRRKSQGNDQDLSPQMRRSLRPFGLSRAKSSIGVSEHIRSGFSGTSSPDVPMKSSQQLGAAFDSTTQSNHSHDFYHMSPSRTTGLAIKTFTPSTSPTRSRSRRSTKAGFESIPSLSPSSSSPTESSLYLTPSPKSASRKVKGLTMKQPSFHEQSR